MNAMLEVDHLPTVTEGSQHDVSDTGVSGTGMHGVLVRTRLTVSGAAPRNERAPIGITFVIDCSASMRGARMDAIRQAIAQLFGRLQPTDVVSVVAFDDAVRTIAVPDRRGRQTQLDAVLQEMPVGGATNLSGGWLRGREHMQYALGLLGALPGTSRRIVLLTDGYPNRGITEAPTLVELARAARHMGISTTTVGIGDDYDDRLLRLMADAGGGNSWRIAHPSQAYDVLSKELGTLLSVCAHGVTATLALKDAVTTLAMHSAWPTVQTAPNTFVIDLGDLCAVQPKPLRFDLFVPQPQFETRRNDGLPIAMLTLSATVIREQGGVEHRTMQLPVGSVRTEVVASGAPRLENIVRRR